MGSPDNEFEGGKLTETVARGFLPKHFRQNAAVVGIVGLRNREKKPQEVVTEIGQFQKKSVGEENARHDLGSSKRKGEAEN